MSGAASEKLPPVRLVGVGDDGCASLTSKALDAVLTAQVLVGGERQLAFFPQFEGRRIPLKGGLREKLAEIQDLVEDNNVCILASGDPLFFGVGSLVVKAVGAEQVMVLPHPSAVQLAFARLGLKWDDAALISLHGRPLTGLVTRLRGLSKVALLTDGGSSSAARIAAHMLEYGESSWRAHLCENLAGPEERIRAMTLSDLASEVDVGPLNVLILVRERSDWQPPPTPAYLPEDAFAKKLPKRGLITKREVRMLSLAAMELRPDSVVWDIGTASGSVAIEAGLLAPRGQVWAVEVDEQCVGYARDNARAHGSDNVNVVHGSAPEALAELPDPDAVFVGGSRGSMDAIVGNCLARLRPSGRLVINTITMENVHDAYRAFRDRSIVPEVTLVNISRGVPLARYLRYEALNPIHIFAATKSAQTVGSKD